MIWSLSNRFDPRAASLADRHYSRRKIGSPQFMPPGSCCVLYAATPTGEAVWGWTYRKAGFVEAGETKGGLLALQLTPDQMPQPAAPIGLQGRMS